MIKMAITVWTEIEKPIWINLEYRSPMLIPNTLNTIKDIVDFENILRIDQWYP